MNSPKVRLLTTQDGSTTLYLPELDETYHSTRGALGESIHVYIENGINTLTNTEIKLLEVGFGTGLNALLTYQFAKKKHVNVCYHTLEPFPLLADTYKNLGYAQVSEEQGVFEKMHAIVEGNFQFTPFFDFNRYQKTLEEFSPNMSFDIIYFDAFAPSKQPEIWSKENLGKCFSLLDAGGIMVTYCAQGQFKRDLAAIGFQVEVLPGGMGKKEMVRARKPE